MRSRLSSATFVGRGDELRRAEGMFAEASQGLPRFLLVAGEAGVGKSRLIAEVASHARASGATVLVGGCVPLGAEGLPYGPFIEALRTLAETLEPTVLDTIIGSGRLELSRLLPGFERQGENES